jgi:hypothetical protein
LVDRDYEYGDTFGQTQAQMVVDAISKHGNNIFADTADSSAQDKLAQALYGALNFDELTAS